MTAKRISVIVMVAVALPIVVAVAILIFNDRWFPAGDMAQAELHMRGFFHRPPLVGAAGRIVSDSGFQGSHPGPSLWFAMLPVYLIAGRSSAGLMAAVASVHVVSIVAIVLLARRRLGTSFACLTALGIGAVVRSSGPDFMVEPWNPWLALLPFAVFVLLVMEVVDPHVSEKPVSHRPVLRSNSIMFVAAVVVGSHCVQSHAGYVLLVVPPLAALIVLLTVRALRSEQSNPNGPRSTRVAGPAMLGLAGALLMWTLPIVDQIRRRPGNLSILWQHFGSPSEPTLGLTQSVRILTSQINVLGPWLFGPQAAESSWQRWLGFMGFAVLTGSAYVIAMGRRGNRTQRVSMNVLLGFISLGAVSILRIFGPYYEYTVRWLWLLSAMCVTTSVWIIWTGSRTRIANARLMRIDLIPVSVALSLGLCGVTVWQVADEVKLPGRTDSRIIGGVIDDVAHGLDRDQTYQIRFYDPYTLNATGFGLLLELERRGFHVKVDPEFAAAALPHRTAPMQDTDGVIWVVVGPALERALHDPALTPLARFNPRSPAQQSRAAILLGEVRDGLKAAGRDDLVSSLDSPGASILFTEPPLPESTAKLVRELIGMGQPTGVFLMAVGDVADSLG